MTTPEDFVEVTSRSATKRHLAQSNWRSLTLCGHDAYHQNQLNARIGVTRVIAELPPCKQCDKSKQRRIDGRPS